MYPSFKLNEISQFCIDVFYKDGKWHTYDGQSFNNPPQTIYIEDQTFQLSHTASTSGHTITNAYEKWIYEL